MYRLKIHVYVQYLCITDNVYIRYLEYNQISKMLATRHLAILPRTEHVLEVDTHISMHVCYSLIS